MSPGKGDGFTAGLAKPTTKFRARVGITRVRLPQRRCLNLSGGCASLGGDAGDVRRGQDGRTLASGTLGHGVALNVTNLAIPVTSGLKAACGYSGSPSPVSQPYPPSAIGPSVNARKNIQAGKSPGGHRTRCSGSGDVPRYRVAKSRSHFKRSSKPLPLSGVPTSRNRH